MLNEGLSGCDWGRVVDEHEEPRGPLDFLPCACRGRWVCGSGRRGWQARSWGVGLGYWFGGMCLQLASRREPPYRPRPPNLCHHPFFSEPSSILQLADEVLWACLAFVKSRWEGAGHVAGGDPAGAGLRLSGQGRALREAGDA